MKRIDMVRFGAEQLFTAERSVELAFSDTTALASSLSRMRLDSDMAMVVGQETLSTLSDAIAALTQARGLMVQAHDQLNGIKTKIGCGAVSVGTTFGKPEKDPPATTGYREADIGAAV